MSRILYDLTGAHDLRFSPNCWRSRLALAHKELEVECEPCRFTEKDKIAFSGQKQVPVLRDGDTVINDSWDIACYLEETYPGNPSLFGGPVGQGLANHLNWWTNAVLHPAIVQTVLIDIHDSLDPEDQAYFRESRESRFGKPLEDVAGDQEARLATTRQTLAPTNLTLERQKWICGDGPAYGDYLIFSALQWARAVSPVAIVEHGTAIYNWNERMLDLFDGLGRMIEPKAA
jgi:glutathione S-transferase